MIHAPVVVTSPSFSKNVELVAELKRHFTDVRTNAEGRRLAGKDLVDFIGRAPSLILGTEPFTREVVQACGGLKVVSKYGVGLDNVDFEACAAAGIPVLHTQGVNRRSVSELTLCLILGLFRNVFMTSQQLRGGMWNKAGGAQLSGKTVGILGFGHVGQDLAGLLQPFGCRIHAYDIADRKEIADRLGVRLVGFETLVRESDVLSLHVPLDASTRNAIGESVFKQMKRGAFFVNTSRGGIVDEKALHAVLESGRLAGAASDVFSVEPAVDQPLVRLPGFCGTPHIGGNAEEAVLAMGRAAIGNLVAHWAKK